jgi:DNA-binding transcriptional MerR regulator
MAKRLTIGELSRRTGVPVRTIRFYSDAGLLVPLERTRSGYRLFVAEDALRIDLIRTLRDAGVGLESIGRVLRNDMKLEEALSLRLRAVEAHIASLQRVAAALRAAIRPRTSETNLRRLAMVTKLSNDERRRVIEAFYAKAMGGLPVAHDGLKDMVDVSVPTLPEDATPEQLDAWVELATILDEESFVASVRTQAFWSIDVDPLRLDRIQGEFVRAAAEARARGVDPESTEASAFAQDFIGRIAAVSGETDEAVRERLRARFDRRAERYWELVAIMKGQRTPEGPFSDWRWFGAAVRHHLAA